MESYANEMADKGIGMCKYGCGGRTEKLLVSCLVAGLLKLAFAASYIIIEH
jgi:hypothetical protein